MKKAAKKLIVKMVRIAALGFDILDPGAKHFYHHKMTYGKDWIEIIF